MQFSRGHWRSEEGTGAVRSAGWWESVTVTWSPTPAPGPGPSLLRRALASAVDMIAPSVADLAAASARHLLERQRRARSVLPSPRRRLSSITRELPRSDRTP